MVTKRDMLPCSFCWVATPTKMEMERLRTQIDDQTEGHYGVFGGLAGARSPERNSV